MRNVAAGGGFEEHEVSGFALAVVYVLAEGENRLGRAWKLHAY